MNFKKEKKNKGFTLIEMLVSMTLFSFVVTIALGALFTILKANEKTKVIKLVVNNLSIALEGMSREIRVGYDYTCNNINSDECSKFEFKTKDGCDAFYEFNDSTIYKKIEKKPLGGGSCSEGDVVKVAIVGSDIDIDELKFRTVGLGAGGAQPRVLISLRGIVSRATLKNDEIFNIQTTISQRKIQP
ncbi:MAG TPA: type II secretion system protein [Bacteroidia bacterium]|nr:type II secretion system protein [Bacteroidia bacterium]